MRWSTIKKKLKETYDFQEWDQNYLMRAFYIPWGTRGREYIYTSSNSFDQALALCRVFVTPSTISMELFDQPFTATYDSYYGKTHIHQSKEKKYDSEWTILMNAYKKDYNKEYPLSLKNIKLVLDSITGLSEEMPHCFEDVEIS